MGAFCTSLLIKVDFARRILATRRLLDSVPKHRLLTGHGKGPWDDIGGLLTRSEAFAAFRHMLEAADDGFDA